MGTYNMPDDQCKLALQTACMIVLKTVQPIGMSDMADNRYHYKPHFPCTAKQKELGKLLIIYYSQTKIV